MKKTLFLLLAATAPLITFAQKPFKISGEFKSLKNGDRIFLSYKENGKQHSDSTVVKNGLFEFTGTTNGLDIGYFSRNDNPLFADLLHDSAPVFIQPGNIKISGADLLRTASVTGTALNNDNTELKFALMPLSNKLFIVSEKYDALTHQQQADVTFTDPIKVSTDSLLKLMEPIKFKFIKSHPDSYVSVLTLERMMNHADLLQVADAYNALTAANKSSALGKSIGETISAAKRSQIGVMATGFELNTSTGSKVKLSDFKGKYVLVDFWASWCLPCRDENPNVVAAYNKYGGDKFTILSISIDSQIEKNAWLKAIKTDKLPWTQAIDNYKPAKSIKDLYGVSTIPANVLIDPSGKIVAKNIKGKELHQTLQKILGN
ncbi:redoxin domain-containing protein [Mucilaginibacter litoreus]|uniref:Redoxin domain-containing protein n=1 Tax=Mucilaginibacter litoreus TaxID=1048221 RepID=A0ABW3AT02_9SPHI